MYVVTLYNPQPTSFFFRFWLKEIILCAEIFYGEWFYCSIFQLSHEYIYGSCDFISGEISLLLLKMSYFVQNQIRKHFVSNESR